VGVPVRPKLRRDLVVIAVDLPDDEQVFKIKDPVRNAFMTASALQYSFFSRFDGVRDLQTICREVSEFFETEIPGEFAEKLVIEAQNRHLLDVAQAKLEPQESRRACKAAVRSLRRSGYWQALLQAQCDSDSPRARLRDGLRHYDVASAIAAVDDLLSRGPDGFATQVRATLHASVFGTIGNATNWKQIAVPLFSPDRALQPLARYVGWMFDPRAMAIAAPVLLCLDLVLFVIVPPAPEIAPMSLLAQVLGAYFITSLFHELGHAVAVKRAGGSVRSIGFLIWYLFMFGAYTDISDVNIIPSRTRRIAIYSAGIFVDLILTALFFVGELVVADGSLARALGYLGVTGMVIISLNMTPVFRTDGYLVLQDLFGLMSDGLMETSSALILEVARNLFRRQRVSLDRFGSPWRQRLLLLFGVSRIATRLIVLSVFARTYLWLTARFGGWGATAFAAILVSVFGRAIVSGIVKLFRAAGKLPRVVWRRPMQSLCGGAFAGGVFWLLFLFAWPAGLVADGEVRCEHTDVRAPFDGVVADVVAQEGQYVEAGAVLAHLDDVPLIDQLKNIRAEAARLGARRQLLSVGATRLEAAAEKARLARARAVLSADDRAAGRSQLFASEGLTSSVASEDSVAQRNLALSHVLEQRSQVVLTEAKGRYEELAALDASLRKLDAQANGIEMQIEQATLRSPIAGVIATAELRQRLGSAIARGEPFCRVINRHHATIEAHVLPGDDLNALGVGQPVKAWTATGERFYTTLDTLPVRVVDEDNRAYLRALTKTAEVGLPDGARVTLKIYGKPRSIVSRLTYPLLRYASVDFWALW
jgi:multidrug resistance efflux pump